MRRAMHLFGTALRETGQAVDRLGLTMAENEIYKETFARHRSVMNIYDKRPVLAAGVFVAPNASVIGEVLVYDSASVWYGAVLRGDKSKIKIGSKTNVQDRAVINTVSNLDSGFPADVNIGDNVTIGHGALLTSCIIGDRVLIGQGSIVQEGTEIGSDVILAAGAVVAPGTNIPSGQMWAGNPAKFIRECSEAEMSNFEKQAGVYEDLANKHSAEFLPFGTVYQHAEKMSKK